MLANYFKIAFRQLQRHQLYSFINIGGLAVGTAVSLLILLYVVHERSYDGFHRDANRTVQLATRIEMGSMVVNAMEVPFEVSDRIRRQTPKVVNMTRLISGDWQGKDVIQYKDKPLYVKDIKYAEPSFFDLFDFPMKQGNGRKALARPQTVILTESLARKLFGKENPIGKVLTLNQKHSLEVAGVMQDLPSNTTFSFPMLISASSFDLFAEEWQRGAETSGETFLKLANQDAIDDLALFINKNIALSKDKEDKTTTAYIVPIAQRHLDPNGDGSGTSYVTTFAWIGVIILLLALINYMNLTTARATMRAKEVGMRKVLGGNRGELIRQFFVESSLISVLAFGLGIGLLLTFKTQFMTFIDAEINDSFLRQPYFLITLVGILFVSILVSGSYPALVLSGFALLSIIKGGLGRASRFGIRQVLVVFQFVLSGGLIICTLVVQRQLNYMKTKDMGMNTEHVMGISLSGNMAQRYTSFRNDIQRLSGVQRVASGSLAIFDGGYNVWSGKTDAIEKPITLMGVGVDNGFVETLGLHWKQPPQKTAGKSYVAISQTAAKQLGIAENPVGQSINLGDDQKEVAGVLDDFFMTSVKSSVRPMIMFIGPDTSRSYAEYNGTLYVRFDKQANLPKQMAAIEHIFRSYAPETPFEYYFLDEAFNRLFRMEQQLSNVLTFLAYIAIFIACLGLFGLATFTAETRTKEIGIRKVLGASITSIVALLSKDFLKLVLIAIVIASPIAWYAMNEWLADFAYKIEIRWWVFALAGGLAVGIALITVSFQSVKAALMNPVESLRSE